MPLFGISDPEQLKRRAGIIEIKNTGAFIKDIKFVNGQVIGEIQTLSGFKGPDLANVITKDKIDIGFSLRALGSVSPLTDGTLDVSMPIRSITYDVVSSPSHENAKITEFMESDLSMSLSETIAESEMVLAESQDLTLLEQQDGIIINNNYGNQCIKTFTQDLIFETLVNVVHKGLRFRI